MHILATAAGFRFKALCPFRVRSYRTTNIPARAQFERHQRGTNTAASRHLWHQHVDYTAVDFPLNCKWQWDPIPGQASLGLAYQDMYLQHNISRIGGTNGKQSRISNTNTRQHSRMNQAARSLELCGALAAHNQSRHELYEVKREPGVLFISFSFSSRLISLSFFLP